MIKAAVNLPISDFEPAEARDEYARREIARRIFELFIQNNQIIITQNYNNDTHMIEYIGTLEGSI